MTKHETTLGSGNPEPRVVLFSYQKLTLQHWSAGSCSCKQAQIDA